MRLIKMKGDSRRYENQVNGVKGNEEGQGERGCKLPKLLMSINLVRE